MRIRPRAQQNVIPITSAIAVAVCPSILPTPLLPQEGDTVPIPPPAQGRKRTAPESHVHTTYEEVVSLQPTSGIPLDVI